MIISFLIIEMTKSRKMKKGGFWESVSSGWNTVTQGASSVWDQTKKAATSGYQSAMSSTTPKTTTTSLPASSTNPPSTTTPTPSTSTYPTTTGGSRRKRKLRGGCYWKYASSLAENAAPYSGSPTAQAEWVGGAKRKTRRHSKKHSTRKHK